MGGVMRRITASFVAVIVALLALGVSPPGAGAHAVLSGSTPAEGESLGQGPTEVIFYFTEGIEVNFSDAYVVDTQSKRWEVPNEGAFHIHTDPTNPGLIMQPNMPNGTYTVVWDVLSAVDGHRTKGFFTFFVGPPPLDPVDTSTPPPGADLTTSVPPEWLEVFTRWFNFAAMAALIGAVSFPFLVLPAAVERLNPSPANEGAVRRALHISRISVLVSVVALLVASLMAVWVQAWLASGESTSLDAVREFISASRYGDIWLVRMALTGGALVCAVLIMSRSRGEWHESILHPKNTPWAVLAALAIALPITTSLNSHAAAGGDFNFQTAIDYIHLVAGGLWLGLLLQLLLAILLVVPRVEERAGFLAGSVRRFSWIAVPAVVVIIITGVIQSIDRLGGIDELFDSDYGLTLAAKILLLAPVLVIAAFNLLVFGPRFISFARQRAQALLGLRPWEGAFRTALVLEVGLAIGILGITALLTNTSPPGSAETGGGSSDATNAVPTPQPDSGFALVDDLSISVWAEPGTPGANAVNVLVVDQDDPEEAVQRVILRFRYLGEDLGVSEAEATALHPPTHWVADTNDLSLPGEWEAEVIVRREGLFDTIGTVQLEIGA
jgi:copper transport protein